MNSDVSFYLKKALCVKGGKCLQNRAPRLTPENQIELFFGQKSLFERAQSRLMTIGRGAKVNVRTKGDVVVVSLSDKDDIKRLFSSKPAEVLFQIKIPDDPEISQTVTVTYQ